VILSGFPYQPMPPRDRLDPIFCDWETFYRQACEAPAETRADLFLQNRFSGFGKLTAREIVFRAFGDAEAILNADGASALWESLRSVVSLLEKNTFSPCLIYESRDDYENGKNPIDFSFMEIRQFSSPFYVHSCDSISECIENINFQVTMEFGKI
jgi:predicted ribosome quality control (RQC) complex YloA/Tae2 family protein